MSEKQGAGMKHGTEPDIQASAPVGSDHPSPRLARRTIRLYRYELEMLPEYSCTMPTLTTIGKTWRCADGPDEWLVAEYVRHSDPTKVGVLVLQVEFLEGPAPLCFTGWKNIGPRLWVAFEHDVRRGHDVRKLHAVQLCTAKKDPNTGISDEFVRITRFAPGRLFESFSEVMQDAVRGIKTGSEARR